jgi:uncharacterized membrane protein
MESRIRVLGHPLHQVLVALPIGAFALAVTSDVAVRLGASPSAGRATSQSALTFGLATAALAAPFGLVDWLAIRPATRAKRVGLWHALGNVAVLGLFASARLLRSGRRTPASAMWLAAGGLGALGFTGWLGGELINRHGIGVHDVLGEDVTSSLSA